MALERPRERLERCGTGGARRRGAGRAAASDGRAGRRRGAGARICWLRLAALAGLRRGVGGGVRAPVATESGRRRPPVSRGGRAGPSARSECARARASEPRSRGPPRSSGTSRRASAMSLRESFHALLLDGRHRLIAIEPSRSGTLTASLVHPREVFRGGDSGGGGRASSWFTTTRAAIRRRAEEDHDVTDRLAAAGRAARHPRRRPRDRRLRRASTASGRRVLGSTGLRADPSADCDVKGRRMIWTMKSSPVPSQARARRDRAATHVAVGEARGGRWPESAWNGGRGPKAPRRGSRDPMARITLDRCA